MTVSYVLTSAAEADLRDIIRYTRKQWGEAQARSYVAKLKSCVESVASGQSFFKNMSVLHSGQPDTESRETENLESALRHLVRISMLILYPNDLGCERRRQVASRCTFPMQALREPGFSLRLAGNRDY